MKSTKSPVLAFLLALFALLLEMCSVNRLAHAEEVQATWTAPTSRVDGSPLYPEEIAEYRLYNVTLAPTRVLMRYPGNATSGIFYFEGIAGCATFALTAVDIQSLESDFSVGARMCPDQSESVTDPSVGVNPFEPIIGVPGGEGMSPYEPPQVLPGQVFTYCRMPDGSLQEVRK